MTEASTAGRRRGDGPRLGRMAVPKRSGALLEELRNRILSGELAPGTMLPPERALVEDTGLSRMTVREALKLLEAEGLVEIRAGRSGGATVRRLDGSGVARQLDLYIRSHEVPLRSLFEVREALEPACAALAARHRTDADLAALEEGHAGLVKALRSQPKFLDQYLSWHLLLARASGNEVMHAVIGSTNKGIWALVGVDRFKVVELRRLALHAHRGVLDAVAAGDEDAARRRMSRHIVGFTAAMAEVPGLGATLAPLPEPDAD